jgi:hypothetical protein
MFLRDSVSVMHGATVLTRTPPEAHSSDSAFAIWWTAAFAGDTDHALLECNLPKIRSDLDDAASILGEHNAFGGLGCEEDALYRGIEGPVVLVFGNFERVTGTSPSGIVHQNIDPAKGRDGLIDERAAVLDPVHVNDNYQSLTAQGLNLISQLLDFLHARSRKFREYDVCCGLRQTESDRAADAL